MILGLYVLLQIVKKIISYFTPCNCVLFVKLKGWHYTKQPIYCNTVEILMLCSFGVHLGDQQGYSTVQVPAKSL